MAYLFNVQQPNRDTSKGAIGDYRASTLTRLGNGVMNVVENFPWTHTKSNIALKQTPYIELTEYYLLDSAVNQMLKAYNQTISSSTLRAITDAAGLLNPNSLLGQTDNNLLYENLYDHNNPTGFSYRFPYFENPSNTQNNWVARSSYDFMIQLQRVLAEVEAQTQYLQMGPQGSDLYLKGMDELLKGNITDPAALNVLIREAAARTLERSTTPITIPGTKGNPKGEIIPLGEFAQRIRKMLIDLNVLQVDYTRTMEQLNIALQSGIGNIGSDPVLDKPHIWSSSQPRVFNISFPLFNTHPAKEDNPNETIARNWELCYLLTYQNLYNKRNLFTGIPPVFYKVDVPGIYFTKAAYVSNITILNVGNIRNMFLPVGNSVAGTTGNFMSVNVPDAYFVNMTLVDFFMPSRNFLDSINDSGKRITITQPGGP
jgi:hypothetical protein